MEICRKNAKYTLPSFYLTLLSIIQSLALGYLLSSLKESNIYWNWSNTSASRMALISWLQFSAIYQALIVVWHEYVVKVTIFSFVYDLADSIIPFAFAVTEFALIAFVGRPLEYWFYAMAAFAFITVLAYLNLAKKVNADNDNSHVRDALGKSYFPFIFGFVSSAVVIFLLIALFVKRVSETSCIGVCILTNCLFIAFFIHGRVAWKRVTR